MKHTTTIARQLDSLKIRNFIDVMGAIVVSDSIIVEIWFPRYTDADKAIIFLNSKGVENTGRESNKNTNIYYKFKTEISIKAENP